MNHNKQILLDAVDLQIGESKRMKCPVCGGGSTRENSLSVTRETTGLLYNCFRASCGAQGFVPTVPGGVPLSKPKPPKTNPYTGHTELVPDDVMSWLQEKYLLTYEEVQENAFRFEPKYRRLIMPIFNFQGYEFGCVAKSIGDCYPGPKAVTYIGNPSPPRIHFPKTRIVQGPYVLVEDILSSVRVARYARTVALLGTEISSEGILNIQQQTDHVIVMLDEDTWHKDVPVGVKLKKRYGLFFKKFSPMYVPKDPKDMTEEELEEIISGAECVS